MEKLKYFVEQQAFGVCRRIGQYMGISVSSIRLYFIYASFLTLGSPVIVYLFLAFWMNIRRMLRKSRNAIWDF